MEYKHFDPIRTPENMGLSYSCLYFAGEYTVSGDDHAQCVEGAVHSVITVAYRIANNKQESLPAFSQILRDVQWAASEMNEISRFFLYRSKTYAVEQLYEDLKLIKETGMMERFLSMKVKTGDVQDRLRDIPEVKEAKHWLRILREEKDNTYGAYIHD